MIKVDAGKDLDMEDNTKKTGMEDGVVEENITEETAIENGEEDSAQEEAGKIAEEGASGHRGLPVSG